MGHFFVLKRQQTEKPIKQQPTRPRTTTTAFETATTTNGSHLKLTFDAAVNIHSGGSFLLSLTHTLTPPLSFVSHSLSLSHSPSLFCFALSLFLQYKDRGWHSDSLYLSLMHTRGSPMTAVSLMHNGR